jgi:predicted O-methyltransferase YrrM
LRTDPFEVKQYSKKHPRRLAFTAKARVIERLARWKYESYALPEKVVPDLSSAPDADWSNTAVTDFQIQHLLYALSLAESLTDTVVVEVGSYRGETTRLLAKATSRKLIAVDPFIGYGASEEDYRIFRRNTSDLTNVIHERKCSGDAVRTWTHGAVGMIFIDAVHDYVNTAFDIEAWSPLLVKGGILALHDTDYPCFAGTRKAAFEASHDALLLAHPHNLVILQKS